MDVIQILTMCILGLLALGGLVVAAVALARLASVVLHQSGELSKLAMRKPYWVIETNESGIVKISQLEGRIGELESRLSPDVPADPLENQWMSDGGRTAKEMPPMSPDDEPVDLGERH